MSLNIETAKTSKPLEGFIPNPKLKLLDQTGSLAGVISLRVFRGCSFAPSAVSHHICVNLR
jgi:hypothetical protein